MIFFILILILLGTIVFFHYIQGFFSSTLSAIFAVTAAVFAVSYHEKVAALFGNHMTDYAAPICLLALFSIIYLILRVIFDGAISGNIRMPLVADKVGAVVMGLVAGLFASGVVAISAQEMPFAADIGGFTRYDVVPQRSVTVDTPHRAFTSSVWDELRTGDEGKAGDSEHGVPVIPVDDLVVGTVARLSAPNGSLDSGEPLTAVHPDFLAELFDQRLGIEPGTTHVAVNEPDKHIDEVKVIGLYRIPGSIPETDAMTNIRSGGRLKPNLRPNNSQFFLVVRVMFSRDAADNDGVVRFSPGSARLMVHNPKASDESEEYADYFPVGTMEGTGRLFLNKLDDYLFVNAHEKPAGADLVYLVPKAPFDPTVSDGTFIDIKRSARVDLSGMKIAPALSPDADVAVDRQAFVIHPELNPDQPEAAAGLAALHSGENGAPGEAPVEPAPGSRTSSTPAPAAPRATAPPSGGGTPSAATTIPPEPQIAAKNLFHIDVPVELARLPVILIAENSVHEGQLSKVPGGTLVIQDGKLKTANIDRPRIGINGGKVLDAFYVPQGQSIVQVSGIPAADAPWAFASEPEQYELVDTKGNHYPPNGVFAGYGMANKLRVYLRYIDSTTISGGEAPPAAGGKPPSQVMLIYVVPAGTSLTEFDDHGHKVRSLSVTTK